MDDDTRAELVDLAERAEAVARRYNRGDAGLEELLKAVRARGMAQAWRYLADDTGGSSEEAQRLLDEILKAP